VDEIKKRLLGLFSPQQPTPIERRAEGGGTIIGDPSQMKLTVGVSPNFKNEFTPQAQVMGARAEKMNNQSLGRNPDVIKKNPSPAVRSAIEGAAKEFNVPKELLYDIGTSESGFRPDASNETPEGRAVGIPRGLFQFTPGTWEKDVANYSKTSKTSFKDWLVNGKVPDRNDPVANARAAAYLIKFGQLGRWQASKSNWKRFYTEDELEPYYSQTKGYVKGKTFK